MVLETKMFYIVLYILILTGGFFLNSLFFETADHRSSLLQKILMANNFSMLQYLIFSCPFLFLEKFAVWKLLVVILAVDWIVISIAVGRKGIRSVCKKLSSSKWFIKEEVIVVLVVLFCIPLIRVTTEDIGMQSDQGAYFAHMINLESGSSDIWDHINELGLSEEIDNGLWELQEKLTCLYKKEGSNDMCLHALSTWCVIPALFGKIFGLWDGMGAGLCYLWILTILDMFYTCEKVEGSWCGKYLALGLFATAPLVLYIGKAGLSELTMLWLAVLGLYCLLEDFRYAYLGAICIGMVGFVHLSVLLYIPAVAFVLFLTAVERREKRWSICNSIQMILFILSLWYVYRISPLYVMIQYQRFTLDGKIGFTELFLGISLVVLLTSFILYYVSVKGGPLIEKLEEMIFKYFKWIVAFAFLIIIGMTIYNGYTLCFTNLHAFAANGPPSSWQLRSRYINTGWRALSYLNITNIARATGIVGLLAFALLPFCGRKMKNREKILYLLVLYALFYYTVLRVDTPFNYYASRYFLPVIVPMMTVVLAAGIKRRNWAVYILLMVCLFNSRYWFSFWEGGPQVGQYQLLQDTLTMIPAQEIVFCNPESEKIISCLTNNLRVLNDNEVYNLKNYEEVSSFYEERDKYIISGNELVVEGDLLLANHYLSQYSFGNGKDGSYAFVNGTYEIPLYIYIIEKQ